MPIAEIFYQGATFFGNATPMVGPRRASLGPRYTPDVDVMVHRRDLPFGTGYRSGRFDYGQIQVERGAPRSVLHVQDVGDGWLRLTLSQETAVAHDAHPAWVSAWCDDPTACRWPSLTGDIS